MLRHTYFVQVHKLDGHLVVSFENGDGVRTAALADGIALGDRRISECARSLVADALDHRCTPEFDVILETGGWGASHSAGRELRGEQHVA